MSVKPPNPSGRNQHGNGKILDICPDIGERLQRYFDQGVRQKDIPQRLLKDLPGLSVRSVRRLIKQLGIRTTRNSGLTDLEKGKAILELKQHDPLGRWGARAVKEKLALQSVHVSRDFTAKFMQHEDPMGAVARNPRVKKAHPYGITSAGPNEEWCADGHEKITKSMGISVWGIIDKYSRMELGLFAGINARDSELPVALWLRVVHRLGGMSVTLSVDKGSELGRMITLVTDLRAKYQPYIPEENVPAVRASDSRTNITRERNWRPLWEKELSNIEYFYLNGKIESGFHPNDEFHQMVARWVWAQIVQAKLDALMIENASHRIRGQRNILLPSDARREDLYNHPEEYGGEKGLLI
ncbi:hypothetical protein CC1G_10588 [Coprinopsis cinerea okayama7|uniref:Integrase core domain-containing protein n=1 Tax=Coprinopsis cinerea (strain Okayama-7 / 130 / ATCC MYA-4618 / FGSC 9003) TaxID=240176 RepID=A8P8L6_COPC7|nr:hypothetical protein CC1G_10588 [Coprinopsis cinerea okayama7\|eukprot:XP_001839595.2 hypothetical protein CC1G_10588 [Coprinopsis cinerea okayama7\